MKTHCKIYIILILLALTIALAGCLAKTPDKVDIFWPPHPDEPRIAYVRELHWLSDVQGKHFFDFIFGAPTVLLVEKPYGVFASGNKVYVTDPTSGDLAFLDLEKKKARYLTRESSQKPRSPVGIVGKEDGSFFVADAFQGKVLLFNGEGEYITAFGKKEDMMRPSGLALNSKLNRLYISDTKANMIFVYSLAGERLFSIGKPGSREGEFHNPTNIAIDRKTDNVVVCDSNNFRVQVFDKDGKFINKFGENGDVPGTFARPKGIGVDSEGNIYVADAAFNNIQIFTREGALLTFLGNAGYAPGDFMLPAGLYVDTNDRIYVVDQVNSRVQVFQYMSETWKKEHQEEYRKYLQKSSELTIKSGATSTAK
jgi:DNA-binding beta-propeller fold protein YncE